MSSLARCFQGCKVTPSLKSKNGLPSLIKQGPDGSYATTSFFIDSSGHSIFVLPLELKFGSQKDLDMILASKSVFPPPSNMVKDTEKEDPPGKEADEAVMYPPPGSSFIGFEARSSASGRSLSAVVVEAVSVFATSVKDLVISFETEVTVRAAAFDKTPKKRSEEGRPTSILSTIEIMPILTIKKDIQSSEGSSEELPNLLALGLGAIPDHMQKESSARVHEIRLDPISLEVTLTHAFTISVKSFQGSSLGSTMVSLTIRHSNLHREPVTISNIAIHPGHSRYETNSNTGKNKFGSKYAVTNMTKAVQWGYALQTKLKLPLTLSPYDAYSTVLIMNGGEEMHSRFFTSPISVTGIVGQQHLDTASSRKRVVVAADAHWSTDLVAIEPADAFRIGMKVRSSEVKIGEPMVVSLRIFNLSLEPRNLMLLMAKEEHNATSERDETVNAAVVSEANGYTFGVWGISGEDNGTSRLNRDHSLLAMDGALMLGEVFGQHAVDAELRFVPLREGCLKVPYWKLYDKSTGKWYTCAHNLQIVAKA